ncbi:hypothetical protein [Sphingomonas sp. ABOLF]|uniref:hypothetical protein n=1 Tax=Sphingomonas sp. ABOLF TaxID=1985879 RepID=UPI0019D2B85D|nr:hypothetical protein [Sphingomonas sp. ABOLF]
MKATPFADRPTFTSRDVRAGCFVCNGTDPMWTGGNAQGVAARHHDASGHATWCDVYMGVRYGEQAPDARQIDIEDAISASARSGGEPDAAPLPVPDAPAVAAASESAPKGRSVETRRRMPRGAHGRKPENTHAHL